MNTPIPHYHAEVHVAFWLTERISRLGLLLAPVVARIALALPFLRSGLTRWDGPFSIAPATDYLFEDQFRLHVFGHLYALPLPDQLAFAVGTAEIVLPVLLLIGLATRVAGLFLLLMTGVIQLIYPDGWANFHLYWAALALAVMALDPGALSLDFWLSRFAKKNLRQVAARGDSTSRAPTDPLAARVERANTDPP
jgi:putative oxidoreductase